MRVRVARTSSRRVGTHRASPKFICRRDRPGTEPAGVRAGQTSAGTREPPTTSSSSRSKTFSNSSRRLRAPQSSSSASSWARQAKDDEVVTHKRVEILNPAAAAPVEAVGDPQQCGEFPQAGAVVGSQGGEAGFGRLRVAAAVMAHERGEERDLGGLEAAQLAVLDEIGGVAVMALAGDVLADVVQQRRELEHLAVAVAEPVQRRRSGRTARARAARRAACARRRSCSAGRGSRPTRGAARAGRRTSRSGSWLRTASSTMPSRSAQSLAIRPSSSNRSSAVTSSVEPAGSSSARRCSSSPGSRRRSDVFAAHDAFVQRVEVGARRPQRVGARRHRARRPTAARPPCARDR